MEYNLKYRNVMIAGFPESVLKSAIQKYCRRKEMQKGMICLQLLFSVSKFQEKEPIRVKTIISNTINRLIVMMSEDIGIAQPEIVIKVHHYYTLYLKNRDLNPIYHLYSELLNSQKCRYISDLRTVFNLPFMEEEIMTPGTKKYTIEEWFESVKNRDTKQTFLALNSLLQKIEDRKQVLKLLWDKLIGLNYHISIEHLHFFYKKMTHKEKTIYFYHAVLIYLFQLAIPIPISFLSNKHEPIIIPKDFQLDPYVYDQHTKDKTKNSYDFALEGAWIYQEKIIHPQYRISYIRKKQLKDYPYECFYDKIGLDGPHETFDSLFDNSKTIMIQPCVEKFVTENITLKEWNDIQKLPHGQKRCGKHKKVVYISDLYTYKGIYQKTEKTFQTYLFYQYWIQKLEEHVRIKTVLPITLVSCQDHPGQYFVKTQNIGHPIQKENIEIISTKIEENALVLKRNTYIQRASDAIEHLDTLQKKICLFHLYERYLLNIGDSGLHNILVSKDGKIFGIDFEEQRGSIRGENLFQLLFSRQVSRKDFDLLFITIYWVDWISNEAFSELPKDVKDMMTVRNQYLKCMLQWGKFYE